MQGLLRLSEQHVRRVHRDVPDPGPDAPWPTFTEADYDEHLAAFMVQRPNAGQQLFVFAYGSLIWKPVFEPTFTERAVAIGWQRRFTLNVPRFRGTPDKPGLMMQIDRGGTCDGVVQAIAPEREQIDLAALWRREMTVKPPGNQPRWIEVESEGRRHSAIAFTANPDSPNYRPGLDIDQVARRLAFACGHWGSGADYVLQTVRALESHGIHDTYLWDLQARIADLIDAGE